MLLQEDNARAVREADIVILACNSNSAHDILGKPNVRSAFREHEGTKILVSLLGGVATTQLKHSLQHSSSNITTHSADQVLEQRCAVIRAIPNMAARLKQSMTVLSLPPSTPGPPAGATANTLITDPLPAAHALVSRLFSHIGATEWLPEALLDNGASLCAATPALFATLIGAIASSDGAVAIDAYYGGPRGNHALRMAAYAARGTADLLLAGQPPEQIRNEVATEGGATRRGLDALHRMKVAEALREAMMEIFAAAGTLGQWELSAHV